MPGGSLFELTRSLQDLVHDLTSSMATVADRLAALEERTATAQLSEALGELGREMVRSQAAVSQRLTALEQRPDASHAFVSTVQDLSADIARWTAGVSERLTALEQRPDPTERLRASIDDVVAAMGGISERLDKLESRQTDPTPALADIDRKLDKVLAGGSPRELGAGVRTETASLHADIETVRGEVRHLSARMLRLTEALFGGTPG